MQFHNTSLRYKMVYFFKNLIIFSPIAHVSTFNRENIMFCYEVGLGLCLLCCFMSGTRSRQNWRHKRSNKLLILLNFFLKATMPIFYFIYLLSWPIKLYIFFQRRSEGHNTFIDDNHTHFINNSSFWVWFRCLLCNSTEIWFLIWNYAEIESEDLRLKGDFCC